MRISAIQNHNYANGVNNRSRQQKDKMNFGMISVNEKFAKSLATCRTSRCLQDFFEQIKLEKAKKINLYEVFENNFTNPIYKNEIQKVIGSFGDKAHDFDIKLNPCEVGMLLPWYDWGAPIVALKTEIEHTLPNGKKYKGSINYSGNNAIDTYIGTDNKAHLNLYTDQYDKFTTAFIMPYSKDEYLRLYHYASQHVVPINIPVFPRVELLKQHLRNMLMPKEAIKEQITKAREKKQYDDFRKIVGDDFIK